MRAASTIASIAFVVAIWIVVEKEKFSGTRHQARGRRHCSVSRVPSRFSAAYSSSVYCASMMRMSTPRRNSTSLARGRGIGACFLQHRMLSAGLSYFQDFDRARCRADRRSSHVELKPVTDANSRDDSHNAACTCTFPIEKSISFNSSIEIVPGNSRRLTGKNGGFHLVGQDGRPTLPARLRIQEREVNSFCCRREEKMAGPGYDPSECAK